MAFLIFELLYTSKIGMEKDNKNKRAIIIYRGKKGPEIKVRLKRETVWLSQKQIADLYQKGVPAVNEHIKNIFREKELDEKSTIRKFRIVQAEGSRKVERDMDFYNLDMILSVGYRVSSKQATQFRIWATKTLKNYLIKGFAINENRLIKQADILKELQGTIDFLREKSKHELLSGREQDVLQLLSGYSRSLTLLEQYDKNKLKIRAGKKAVFIFEYENARKIIKELKEKLTESKEAGDLFGREYPGKFEAVISGIYQTFGGKDLYESLEEKAAHLLYFTIKDHPFVDGNKRVASFLFVYFLDKNNYLHKDSGERKINDNALVALALLVAVSDPKEKDTMIKIIANLIK